MRSPWLNEYHKSELIKARQILVGLTSAPQLGVNYITAVQTNTQESELLHEIIADIEKLLGY